MSDGGGEIAWEDGYPRAEGEIEEDMAVAWARKGGKEGEDREEEGGGFA